MSCNQQARSGRHNCRCKGIRVSSCLWHGIPTSSIKQQFNSMMVAAFADPVALTIEDKLAPLTTLARLADAAMLPPTWLPLDDRPQRLIDYFTAGRSSTSAAQ